jgi:hypothetical protein
MTKLTKQEWNKMTRVPPNPMWTVAGTVLGILMLSIMALGMVWLIKILIEAIF